MPRKFRSEDPRYHDRFTAAVELLKMWRNIVQDGPGVPRYVILPGAALNRMVTWTDDYLLYHGTHVPKFEDVAKP